MVTSSLTLLCTWNYVISFEMKCFHWSIFDNLCWDLTLRTEPQFCSVKVLTSDRRVVRHLAGNEKGILRKIIILFCYFTPLKKENPPQSFIMKNVHFSHFVCWNRWEVVWYYVTVTLPIQPIWSALGIVIIRFKDLRFSYLFSISFKVSPLCFSDCSAFFESSCRWLTG